MLALYDGERPSRYVIGQVRGDGAVTVVVPAGVQTTPIVGRQPLGGLVPVTEPVEATRGGMPRITSTTPAGNSWLLLERAGPDFRPSTVVDTSHWEEGYNGEELATCMRAEETLAGPDGRFHEWQLRGYEAKEADSVFTATAVFGTAGSSDSPTALAFRDGIDYRDCIARDRLDLPGSDADTRWTFLGPLPDNGAAMLEATDAGSTYVHVTSAGAKMIGPTLPSGAQARRPARGAAADDPPCCREQDPTH